MGEPRYRHRQVAWIIVGVAAVVAAGMLLVVTLAGVPAALLLAILPALVILVLCFSTLTVTVDDEAVSAVFGIGLVRGRIALSSVRSYSEVRIPLSTGYGVRLTPNGRITAYTASGRRAVQFVLDDGRTVWIGTDEPDKLLAAVGSVSAAPVTQGPALSPRPSKLMFAMFAMIGLPMWIVLGVIFYRSAQPPTVVVSDAGLSVAGGIYRAQVNREDVIGIALSDTLPAIGFRSNGFAFGNHLRGHFRGEAGESLVFVDRDAPPYLVVRTRGETVLINFGESSRTRALFEDLQRRGFGS